jgi:hypothetical protein
MHMQREEGIQVEISLPHTVQVQVIEKIVYKEAPKPE